MSVPSWAEPYIDKLNGSGFWWKSYSNINDAWSGGVGLNYYPPETTSWFSRNRIPPQRTGDIYVFTTPLKRVDIISNNDIYSFTIEFNDLLANFPWNASRSVTAGIVMNYRFSPSGDAYTTPISSSGTLLDCLIYLSTYVRNVNLYVDGELWSKVSPITYTWSSVPAISGKNGILSLSILNDINDGNPVTTSDTNKFNLSKTSNLSTLINNAINS